MSTWERALAVVLGLGAACSAETRWGGGTPTPMHPDSQAALPSDANSDAGPGPVEPVGDGKPAKSVRGDAKYVVAPGSRYPSLKSIAKLVEPGDVVEVHGNAKYAGGVRFERDGTAEKPITIRGQAIDGKLPIIAGAADTIEAAGDHYVFEDLELMGATKRCFLHHAHDITVRRLYIHDCHDGLLGADDDSGSLLLEHSEFARSGEGQFHHQIYMATDEKAHPGSVFRMQHCYVHDGAGGNNVKTRAERNEIHYNWIEGALYHELEMIGPDGGDPKLAREDSEVLGNVFFKTNPSHAVRVGGDGTGDTGGRYRFLFNTFVVAGSNGAIRVYDSAESLELYNNAFYRTGGADVQLLKETEAKWVRGVSTVSGANNWLSEGSSTHRGLTATKFGVQPGFASLANRDLRPVTGSPLIGNALASPPTSPTFPFSNPTNVPLFEPGPGIAPPRPRQATNKPSIGAFEP